MWARLATPRERLLFAIGVSVLLHLVLLSTRFVTPSLPATRTADHALEIVLLQPGSDVRPATPEVIAQVDSSGGGESAAERVQVAVSDPADARASAAGYAYAAASAYPGAYPAAGADDSVHAQVDAALGVRMQERIDRQISDYNNRPRRLTFGIDAIGTPYARYVAHWAEQIERIGTEQYPPEARGKLYDSLILTVEIDRSGKVVNVLIDQPSRHEALNRAARRIVRAGEPYAEFSPEMARQGDILQITRTWTFTSGALATAAAPREVAP